LLCPSCQAENREGAHFCKQCGTALALRCPSCGVAHGEGQRFCDECGAVLSATGASARPAAGPRVAAELRMASMLFVDLVGFTTLSESRDAEDVRELLGRYFDRARTIVQRYGGTIEKFIGDAVVAVFGAPVAHGDDPERAVRAALAVCGAVAEMNAADPELDLQLRRRKMTGIVLAGISTSIGVESTARHARELGYEVAVASDAVTDTVRAAHENSLQRIFPRLGQVDTTDAILGALARAVQA